MSKRKVGEIIWLALQYAKQDRKGLANAWGDNESVDVVRRCHADIKAFEDLQLKLFGATRSETRAKIDKMKLVDIRELMDYRFNELSKLEEPPPVSQDTPAE